MSLRSTVRHPFRPRRRALGPLTATVLALLAAVAPASATESTPTTTRLDPSSANGAWAGYSLTGRTGVASAHPRSGSVAGMDVSGHQGDVDWARAVADGARFTYVKATEGTRFRNDHFGQQYNGSYAAGMIRGAYHFALPDTSSGAEQANIFVDHGGGWSPDGRTLPGALDIETNPYGETCYGMDPATLSGWISEFGTTYLARTGRFPAIYTTTNWWNRCTGANPQFGLNHPLWIARYNDAPGELPAGWAFHSLWQFSNQGVFPGDQNSFNGNAAQLAGFAR